MKQQYFQPVLKQRFTNSSWEKRHINKMLKHEPIYLLKTILTESFTCIREYFIWQMHFYQIASFSWDYPTTWRYIPDRQTLSKNWITGIIRIKTRDRKFEDSDHLLTPIATIFIVGFISLIVKIWDILFCIALRGVGVWLRNHDSQMSYCFRKTCHMNCYEFHQTFFR